MKIDLHNKTALVTGSTSGIGFAAAKGLAAAGASVILNGRKPETVQQAVERLQGEVAGAKVVGFATELGSAAGAAALVQAHPQVEILVNNVGIYEGADFLEADDEMWQRHLDVNLFSAIRLARAYLPGQIAKGWGRIILIASESAFNIPVEMIHYGVSKTAVVGLARGLAKHAAGTGVTVNSVLPGPTLTEGAEAIFAPIAAEKGISVDDAGKEFIQAHRNSSIIRRLATVEEVASMIVYTASEQASATTGASLRVDGGVVDSL